MSTFSKKSSQKISDQTESCGKNRSLFVSVRKEIVNRNYYHQSKRSQRSQTKQILTAILSGGDGFYHDSRKDRWSIRNWSPYAYGDSPYAYGEEGRKFCIWGVPVHITKLCTYWEQHIHVLGSSSHQSILSGYKIEWQACVIAYSCDKLLASCAI